MTDVLRHRLAGAALVTLAVLLVHRGAVDNEFVSWDDDINLYENPYLVSGSVDYARFWISPYQGLYIPVTYTAWAVLADLTRAEVEFGRFALDPAPFHLLNLVLHAVCSLFVFGLLLTWTRGVSESRSVAAAAVGALLFGLHPLQVEVVHWATGLKDALSTLLALGALLAVPGPPDRWTLRFPGAWALFALALLAKPGVVVLPLLWLLVQRARGVDVTRLGRLHFVVLLALGAAAGALNRLIQSAADARGTPDWIERGRVALDALGFYTATLFAPGSQAPDYGRTPERVLAEPDIGVLVLGVAVVLLGLATFSRRPVLRAAGSLTAAFAAALAPVLGLVAFSHQEISTVADRYAYLALLAPATGLAWVFARTRSRVLAGAVVGLLMAAGLVSVRTARPWQDSTALWTRVLEVNPRSGTAWNNLGFLYEADGDDERALEHYRLALEADPENVLARVNTGNVHYRRGELYEAREAYLQALDLDPNDAHARNNLGAIERSEGNLEEAAARFRAVLGMNSRFAPAHLNLGLVLEERGDLEGAATSYSYTLEINPGHRGAHRGLARLAARAGDLERAREHLARAEGTRPGAAELETAWCALLVAAGADDATLLAARRAAFEAGARHPQLLAGLGRALVNREDWTAARPILELAATAASELLGVRLDLARVYQRTGAEAELDELATALVRDFPFAAPAWHLMATRHRAAGREAKCRQALGVALRLDPDHAPSVDLQAELDTGD